MRRFLVLFTTLLISLSLMGQEEKSLHWGIDASIDCFESSRHWIAPSFGLGTFARLGRHDQRLNLVGGVRYIYGTRLSGFQIPVLLNINLLRGRQFSAGVGGGYEFDFIGSYWGCKVFQAGLTGRHTALRIFYKPYQGDLGAGLTYYF